MHKRNDSRQPQRTRISWALQVAAAGIAGAWLCAGAWAQTAPATSEEDVDTGVSKTQVPTTKQLITRSALDARLPQDGAEAVKDVAGVSSSTSQGAANPATSIRGLQLNLYSNYRLNGGLPTTGIVSVPMENKEAVEVLKGANALQFGLANPAGIINYVTKRAKDADVQTVTSNFNSFGQYGLAVDLGRKFGDNREFGLRVNASATHLESGVKGANGTARFFGAAADWLLTPGVTLKLDYENIARDVIEQAQIRVASRINSVVAVPAPPDPTVLLSGPWAWYRPRTENLDVKAEFRLTDTWRGLAEVGRSDSVRKERMTDQIYFTDAASVASGLGKDSFNLIRDQQYQNRFYRVELYGRESTGPILHDLTVGYSSAQRDQNIPNTVTATQQAINIYNPVLRTAVPVPPSTVQPGTLFYPTTSADAGPFVYDSISFNQDIKMTVGVRATKYFYSAIDQKTNVLTEQHYNITSPGVGLSVQMAPRTTIYASAMSSFEDGGAAPYGTTNQYQILSPTSANQRELGLRTNYWPGLRSSFAYFDITRANNVTVTNANKTTTFMTDGKLAYKGIETTNSLQIDKELSLDIAGQWLKARQRPDLNAALLDKAPPGVPVWSGNAKLNYAPSSMSGLKLNVGLSGMSSKFVDSFESGSIPSYLVYSAGGSYSWRLVGKRTVLSTQLDNLTNVRYWSGVNGTAYAIGLPRSIRMNLRVDL